MVLKCLCQIGPEIKNLDKDSWWQVWKTEELNWYPAADYISQICILKQ
jgi:hypothetical protein